MTGNISPRPLDLFRFSDDISLDDPDTNSDFTTNARNLIPGRSAFFDDLDDELALSTGFFNGDGRQASHFKDNELTGILIGNLDPSLAMGAIVSVSDADLRVLDLIGYDLDTVVLVTPALAAFWLFGSGFIALLCSAKKRRKIT